MAATGLKTPFDGDLTTDATKDVYLKPNTWYVVAPRKRDYLWPAFLVALGFNGGFWFVLIYQWVVG